MTPLASGTLRSLRFVATVPTRTVALSEVELEGDGQSPPSGRGWSVEGGSQRTPLDC